MLINFFCAAGIVALVLLQRGQGADAGAGFGSGASGTVFGARGATTALSRATAILAAIFMITSLSLAYVGNNKGAAVSSSILDQISQQAAPIAPDKRAAPAAAPSNPAAAPAAGAAPASAPPASSGGPATGTAPAGTPAAPQH